MPAVITSLKDDHLTTVRALRSRAGRAEAAGCLLEGPALISQALDAGAALRFVVRVETAADPLGERLAEAGVPVLDTRESMIRQVLHTARPVHWVAVAELAAEAGPDVPYGDFAVLLDGVLDPGNLGTIVRTAVGLGVFDVVCTAEDTDLTSRKVLDASRATVLRARIRRFDSPVDAVLSLRDKGFEVVATSSRGSVAQALTPLRGGPVALVVGNETEGVSEPVLDLADHVVRIPMAGAVESLNVGVATGISLYELRALRAERAALAGLPPAQRDQLDQFLRDIRTGR
ncbi:MAG TPA: RNA methyltransferase [Pseudonocardiaceae bacterium]|nr:RNA methyltransferase [Pseudonocardiaceae bacterium]